MSYPRIKKKDGQWLKAIDYDAHSDTWVPTWTTNKHEAMVEPTHILMGYQFSLNRQACPVYIDHGHVPQPPAQPTGIPEW